MKAFLVIVIVILLVLILPVVISQSLVQTNYWKMFSIAADRIHNVETQGFHRNYSDQNNPHSDVKVYSYRSIEEYHDGIGNLSSSSVEKDICNLVTAMNVSQKCCEDTKIVLASLVQKVPWALQMIDSYGKIPSGLMLGDQSFPGSYDECKSINVAVSANLTGEVQMYQPFSPKYCQVIFPLTSIPNMMSFGIPGVHIGICVPDSCQENDMNTLINTGIHLLPFKTTKTINTLTTCEKNEDFDSKAIFSLVASSLFLLLLVSGTLYDIINSHLEPKKAASTVDGEKDGKLPTQNGTGSELTLVEASNKGPNVGEELLLCFSVYRNGKKLLNTSHSAGTLSCVHGIRFLSMTWVLLGHVYVFGISVFRNTVNLLAFVKQFEFQAIANATVSVDSFFLLSGLLVAYSTLKAFKARDGKMNWVYFYVHRYWRLTPPILLVMMVYIPMFRYMSSGPYWPQEGTEVNFCKDSWFYNILYINNFLPTGSSQACMGWLWYLANDMQFYWISPLILIPLYKWPKIGHVICVVLLLVNFVSTGVIATRDKASVSMLADNQQETFVDIYVKPYTRIGPYLVGILYGYYLYFTQCKLQINKYINAMIWLMASISAVSVLYGLYSTNNGAYMTQTTASLYTAVNRSVWGVCLGWVVFACCTGNGGFVNTILSWKAFIPLSRLTYTAYLVHPIVLFYFYLSQRYPLAPTHITFVFLFLGCMGVTFIIAFLTSMAFEAPMLGLEKVLLQKLKIKR